MIQAQTIQKIVTFDEFVAWYPENSIRKYELHNGVIVEMPLGTGDHSNVTGFIISKLAVENERHELPYSIPGNCLLKPTRNESGYQPDVIVLDRSALLNEPRWKKESIITMGSSVRLAVEVVSTNWQDDYLMKAGEYELIGIPEYWIVDYRGLGGVAFIGRPKQPTFTVCQLWGEDYCQQQYRLGELIDSGVLSNLQLRLDDILPR